MAEEADQLNDVEEPEEPPEEQTFTVPLLGAVYSSLVIVVVVAVLNSHIGRGLEEDVDAPAMALVLGPVIVVAAGVFIASMLALLLPEYRRFALRVAEIGGWLIPAWLVIGAMVLGAIAFAVSYSD
jgi:hypothetical protein